LNVVMLRFILNVVAPFCQLAFSSFTIKVKELA
jgi:hypothetical protein